MLNIQKKQEEAKLTVALEGRLDTFTSADLQKELDGSLTGIRELEFDLAKLEYISSAGLRLLLSAQKTMDRQGAMVVKHVPDAVRDIFEVTGFDGILKIE